MVCNTICCSRSPHGERGLELISAYIFRARAVSLPAWGAWVGIYKEAKKYGDYLVAPRMGSVGWNIYADTDSLHLVGRSPHGERGLEYDKTGVWCWIYAVAPRMGSVGWNTDAPFDV